MDESDLNNDEAFAIKMNSIYTESIISLIACGQGKVAYDMFFSLFAKVLSLVEIEARDHFFVKLNWIRDIIGKEVFEDTEDLISVFKERLEELKENDK